MKKLRMEHIIQVAIHRIKIQIFGNERFGLQSFPQLKRTIAAMKIRPNYNVKTWSKRFNTFQDYLPRYCGSQELNKVNGLKLMEKCVREKS